jgi:hypothetical protein
MEISVLTEQWFEQQWPLPVPPCHRQFFDVASRRQLQQQAVAPTPSSVCVLLVNVVRVSLNSVCPAADLLKPSEV